MNNHNYPQGGSESAISASLSGNFLAGRRLTDTSAGSGLTVSLLTGAPQGGLVELSASGRYCRQAASRWLSTPGGGFTNADAITFDVGRDAPEVTHIQLLSDGVPVAAGQVRVVHFLPVETGTARIRLRPGALKVSS